MKSLRTVTACCALWFSGCGDSSENHGNPDDNGDASIAMVDDEGDGDSEHDAIHDASQGDARALGSACTPEQTHLCDLPGEPTCLTELTVLSNKIEFSGGYCSHACKASDDCGTHGGCPVGDTKRELAGTPMAALFESLPSNCLEQCETPAECREDEGYDCQPMTAAMPEQLRTIVLGVLADKPITKRTFCVPVRAGDP